MNLPRKHIPKYYISLIAISFILVAIPLTVFSVFQARPTSPSAATCYDLNGDGIVDQKDIDLVVAKFGVNYPPYDFNGDGKVTVADIGFITGRYGETCPPTAAFSASRTSINKGQSVTLSWSTTRASSVSITNIGSVSKSGSKVVSPSATKTYKLTATGPGGSVSKSVTISVSVPSTSTSTTSTTTTTTTITPPKDPNSVTLLVLTINKLSQLGGKMNLSVSIKGADYSKGVTITKNTKKINLKIPEGKVKKNKSYTLIITGSKLLAKKVKFKSSDFKKTVKIGNLHLGDINTDNVVGQEDLKFYLGNLGLSDVDANFDEVINSLDYSVILTNFGKKGD